MEYFTEEFFEALEDQLNGDDEFKDQAKDLTTSVVQVAQDVDRAFKIAIEQGTVDIQPVDTSEDGEFRLIADYDDWAKTAQGETSAEKLLMKGTMKLEGNMGKIMRYRDPLLKIEQAGQSLSPSV